MKPDSRKKILRGGLLFAIFLAAVFRPYSDVQALSVSVHVPEKYTEVMAGERFYFELEIRYPENPARKDLRLEYDITKNGEIVAQSKFLKAVETQASFMDYVVIPQSAQKGLYEIKVKISDYENLNEEASATFNVAAKDNSLMIYFFILLGAILALGGFIALEIRKVIKK